MARPRHARGQIDNYRTLAPSAVGLHLCIQLQGRQDANGVPRAPGVQRLACEQELVPCRNQAQAGYSHHAPLLVEVRLTTSGQLPQLRGHDLRIQVCLEGDVRWTEATTASDGGEGEPCRQTGSASENRGRVAAAGLAVARATVPSGPFSGFADRLRRARWTTSKPT